jgi:rod shape-determining protein MreD
MATWIAIPILGLLLLLQTAVLSRFPLLHGAADVVMLAVIAWALQKRVQTAWQWGIIGGLLVGIVSGLPFWATFTSFCLAVMVALALRRRVWQAPILAMFIAVFVVTVLEHLLAMIALRFSGTSVPPLQSLNIITLPSVILNLVLAIPTFYLLSDLAKWLYPEALEP